MRAIIAAALLAPLDAAALELLCSGTRFNTPVGNVHIQTPLLIAEPSLDTAFDTREGLAKGRLTDFGTYYGGYIVSSSGVKFWLYLDRYTGGFNISYITADGKDTADFAGSCERAQRKF